MLINDGGARKKEWICLLKNKKPMYTNTKKGIEHPIFLNKKGRPSYRNKNGIVMEAKDCPLEHIALLKRETVKASQIDIKKKINKTKKKIVLKKKTPTQEARKISKLPNSFFGSPPKRSPTSIKLNEYIEKLKRNEVLPKNKTVKQLTTFCKLADKKLNTVTLNPKPKTPTPKPKTRTPKPKTPTPKPKTPTPKPKTPTTIKKCSAPGAPRCKKGTRCNKKTGNCEPTGTKNKTTQKKTASPPLPDDSLNIMRLQDQDLKEIGLKKSDFFEDVCLVLKNIRKKLNIPGKQKENEWSSKKLIKMHSLIPHTRDQNGNMMQGTNIIRDQYLGGKLIKIVNVLGKGGYGKIYGGTYGGRPCAIKESHEPMKTNKDIEAYYSEIIKQNELFCDAHRAKLNQPKYAKIPKPLFIANMDKTPLLAMEPLDDSLYKFIKNSKRQGMDKNKYKINMTKVITDMFECICNTLIYLQDKYDFYHRDMHCGNIMYRKTGESYQWYLIDFGFSTFKLHNYRFSEKGTGPYGSYNEEKAQQGKSHKGRVGHDLRLTLLFMFELMEDQLEKMIIPEAFTILQNIYLQIKYDITLNAIGSSNIFWHRGYNDAFNKLVTTETEPKNFIKYTIPQLRLAITNYKSAYKITTKTKTKSPSKPIKEYVYVQRNKSLKTPTLGGSASEQPLPLNYNRTTVPS